MAFREQLEDCFARQVRHGEIQEYQSDIVFFQRSTGLPCCPEANRVGNAGDSLQGKIETAKPGQLIINKQNAELRIFPVLILIPPELQAAKR